MSTPSSPRQRQIFILFLLALWPAGKAMEPCLDWDTWWHLRVAQFIHEERTLPDQEPFSQLGRQERIPWIAYSWLYELGMFEVYRTWDYESILAFRLALNLLTFGGAAWFLLRHATNRWLGLGVLALVTVSLLPFTSERPWHFTIFFTLLTLHAVLRLREGAAFWRFLLLPLLFAVWANIHIQFVMGFAVLGLGWLASLVDWRRAGSDVADARRSIMWRTFWLGALCTAATFATPYHYRLYLVIWEYATQTKALRLVMELQPPNFKEWYNWPLVVLTIWAAACTARRGFLLWDLLLLGSALFFSLRMQRDLWYGVIAAGSIVVRSSPAATDERPIRAWTIVLVYVLAALLMRGLWIAGLSRGKTLYDCHWETYPEAAAGYVRGMRYPGPLFNNFDWGGYLIWALPEYPVSVDGRTNFYGEERLIRSMNTWEGIDWEKDPDLLKAGVIIAPQDRPPSGKKPKDKIFPLTALLRGDGRWEAVFEDDTSVVFIPRKPLIKN